MTACECSPCGRKFTGLSTFDRHQDVDYGRRPAVRCVDPASLGMTLNKSGRWGFPSDALSRPAHWQNAGRTAPGGYPSDPQPLRRL